MKADQEQRRTRVIELIATIAEVDIAEVGGSARLREDLGMDSLGSLELLSTLSEELRIDIEIEDAMDIATVDDACAFLERTYVAQAGSSVGDARA